METKQTPESTPKVGMIFLSEDHAYNFYNQYAKSVGFSVRKDSSTVRPDGTIIRRVLCCSKQGYYKNRASFTNLRARSRTGCEARIVILRRGEKFLLIEFNETHNHELVAPNEVYRLRSQRKVEDSGGEVEAPSSTPTPTPVQCNDLANLALSIVAKGNSSENAVVFTRRLLNQVIHELDYFLKADCDKTRDVLDIRDVKHESVCEDKDCVDEKLCDLSHVNVNGESNGKMKGKLDKGKDKRKFLKLSSGLCDQSSVGEIGTTLLMLQDSSTLSKQQDN